VTTSSTRFNDGALISYAQHGEDVVLARLFGDKHDGFYVDVGANDPVADSVTKYFYELGWRGISVEPVPALHTRLCSDRPRDINLAFAISDQDGAIELQIPDHNDVIATIQTDVAETYRREGRKMSSVRVPTAPLSKLLTQHVPKNTVIDFMKVDVEGHEDAVLASTDFSRFRPRVLVVESWCNNRHADYPQLKGHGYTEVLHDGLNRYYLRDEDIQHAHFFRHPANTFDKYVLFRHIAVLRAQTDAALQADALRAQTYAALQADAEQWRTLGPAVQRVARGLRSLKGKHPTAWNRIRQFVIGR
jgi:FkbM family methyltransferase